VIEVPIEDLSFLLSIDLAFSGVHLREEREGGREGG